MKSIKILIFGVLVLCCSAFAENTKQSVNIGVLAHKNFKSTISMWQPTADYLNQKIPEYEFKIIPLKFEEFPPALRDKQIDFVVINSAYYVDLESIYGISRIATLKNRDFNNKPQTEFGGVLFAKMSSTSIRRLEDIKGKSLGAVDKNSFGGWIMALRELKEHGVNEKDVKLSFFGTHEGVVNAVKNGSVEVGTVRSDTLERMAADGKINIKDFMIINQKNHPNFAYLTSTRLYPEWPFAKTRHIPDKLAEQVAIAIISMPENSPAAIASKSFGWTIALDYQSIHECLKELELGPYAYLKGEAITYFLKKYWAYIVISFLLLFISVVTALYIAKVNNRLRDARKLLQNMNQTLEEKVEQKTQNLYEKSEELERSYLKERYLRSILRVVADINQMLITTTSVDELTDKAALRLSEESSFKSARVSLVENGVLKVKASYGVENDLVVTQIDQKVFAENKNMMLKNFDDANVPQECRQRAKKYGLSAVYAISLRSNNFSKESIGVLRICTIKEDGFSLEETEMLDELAGDIGFAVSSFGQKEVIDKLNEEQIKSHREFITALVDMIEQRDTYTAGHNERVSKYCTLIANEMGMPEKDVIRLTAAARLHDIGKVVTPDSILLKPKFLSNLEYELIKEHVLAGYQMLSNVDFYKDLADIVASHHERYDGSGYPYGKKADEIPLEGHILAVADSFDAMTTNRIYKPRKSIEEALSEMKTLSKVQYHPKVVDAAIKVLANISIDEGITQFGTTPVEQERLSYFFRDSLTKLYNQEYLLLLLNGRTGDKKLTSLTIISLTNFTKYNKDHSWEEGDKLLVEFAAFLSDKLPNNMIFRAWGDHFMVADFSGNIKEIIDTSSLQQHGVGYRIKQVSSDIPSNIKAILS